MNIEEIVETVTNEGYVVIPDFIDDIEVNRLNRGLELIFDMVKSVERKGLGQQTVHIHNSLAKTRIVDDYAINPELLTIIEAILGPDFQISSVVAMCPRPSDLPQHLHRDDGHFPMLRCFPLVANTLLALDPFTIENGATQLVPKSHFVSGHVDPNTKCISLEMPAGSIAIWDGGTLHRGGGNTSKTTHRRSLNINFNLAWLKQRENQFLGVAPGVVLSLPERLQQLMGFQLTNIGLGTVDYKNPLDHIRAKVTEKIEDH